MPGAIWVLGETTATGMAKISGEIATLARALGAASGREVVGLVADADPSATATSLAAFVPEVLALAVPAATGHAVVPAIAPAVAALVERESPAYLLVGATPDGRDLAGTLSALLGWGVLTNATGITWADDGPLVEMSAFGGRLLTTSAFTAERGIVTVRPGAVDGAPLAAPGAVRTVSVTATVELPQVAITGREDAAATAAPIEEARVIVAGGRGVGGPDGFGLVRDLADALGGAVGATRAAVDSGWIPYSQQIGQTGKIVKPALYLALGISGAIQHKVGMQTASTIVAINRDPDAPIGEFADMYVIGDLFEVGPAIVAELRARAG
ncbi:MAG TPA: electron transfer flavoprotein subunit alpha/FixB family protein [Candidatus Limnocylindrales bacterium]